MNNVNLKPDSVLIGNVGFDIITLVGFSNLPTQFTLPIESSDFWTKPDDVDGVNVCKNKVTITYDEYILEFGNQDCKSYMKLKIRTCKDNVNLKNMTCQDVITKLAEAKDIFNSIYGVPLDYNLKDINIVFAEINQTFPITGCFDDYKRILRLISYGIIKTKKISQRKTKKPMLMEQAMTLRKHFI